MTKEKKYNIIIALQAIIIAVAFHVILLFLFSVPANDDKVHTQVFKRISLLPVGEGGGYTRDMNNFMEYANPSLISKPSEKFGYGVLTRSRGLRKPISGIKINNKFRKVEFEKKSEPGIFEVMVEPERKETPLPLIQLPASGKSVTKRKYPLAQVRGGDFINDVFIDNSEIDSIISKTTPSGNTVIVFENIMEQGMIPRYDIIQSSGVSELDKVAVRNLIRSDSLMGRLEKGKSHTVTVKWIDMTVNEKGGRK